MSCFAFPFLLLPRMLDFTLAPRFPLVSHQEISIRMLVSPDLQLVLAGFLDVQSIQIHPFDGGFEWQPALNPKWSGTLPKTV
jgi:hypothetical protein